jgi:ABC-type nitrate/sulfonate/bicarbonate transport system permease component
MADIFHSDRKYIYFLSGFFVLWIILFEFILPPNQILPRPSIAVISIISLFKDYQFLVNLISSISAIYFSLIVAGLFLLIFRRFLINNKNLFGYLTFSLEWISGIIPGILMGLFLIIWFPDSEFTKYIFIFFTSFTFLINKLENELKKMNSEFIDAAASLGGGKNFISDKVCWKVVEPALAESLKELHLYLWSMLIVFELIKGGPGLGTVLKTAIMYKDLAGLFSSIIIICLIIFVGATVIKYFKNKFFFWSFD